LDALIEVGKTIASAGDGDVPAGVDEGQEVVKLAVQLVQHLNVTEVEGVDQIVGVHAP
jgi:hypothetical protein